MQRAQRWVSVTYITETSLGQGRRQAYHCTIIVRILRDAWMVASGLVSERGDRVRGHRIRQPFSPRALSGRNWF